MSFTPTSSRLFDPSPILRERQLGRSVKTQPHELLTLMSANIGDLWSKYAGSIDRETGRGVQSLTPRVRLKIRGPATACEFESHLRHQSEWRGQGSTGRGEMPDPLVEEVLDAWKEGEELLPDLPALSPDQETVKLAINDLRSTYLNLVDRGYRSNDHVEASAQRIENSLRAIREVAERNARPDTN